MTSVAKEVIEAADETVPPSRESGIFETAPVDWRLVLIAAALLRAERERCAPVQDAPVPTFADFEAGFRDRDVERAERIADLEADWQRAERLKAEAEADTKKPATDDDVDAGKHHKRTARGPFLVPTPWMKRGAHDSSRWTVRATALERWIEGRGPLNFLPEKGPAKKYVPVHIDWRDDPDDVRDAMTAVASALAYPRVLGTAFDEALVSLNRTYKAWGKEKRPVEERERRRALITEARAVVAAIVAAPMRVPAPDVPPRNTYTSDETARLRELVAARVATSWPHHQDEVEALTHAELVDGDFSKARKSKTTRVRDPLEERVERAHWRADYAVRARLRRETVRHEAEPRISLGGRRGSQIVGGDDEDQTRGYAGVPSLFKKKS